MAKVESITYHHFALDQQQFMEYLVKTTVEPSDSILLNELTRRRENVAQSIENGDLELELPE